MRPGERAVRCLGFAGRTLEEHVDQGAVRQYGDLVGDGEPRRGSQLLPPLVVRANQTG
jgi:hypothetical protein